MKIIPLSEGQFTIDKTKEFIPFDEKQHELQNRPVGSLLVEVQPFVVVTKKDILLFDTGLGFSKNGVLQLHQNLNDVGINSTEITKVLFSHLHKDHAGAITKKEDKTKLSFPNATYFVQQKELEYALQKTSPSYLLEELELLKSSSQVCLLNEYEGVIDNHISYQLTAAHSSFHQVFWVREEDEIVFFGGDVAPQLQQMKHRFIAKYDLDGRKAMELRKQWWAQGEKEKWTFLFYHDIKNPVWRF